MCCENRQRSAGTRPTLHRSSCSNATPPRGPRRKNGATVTKTPKRGACDLETGWIELGEGRWDAARTSFEQALAEQEAPESFEGLSWAAWWLTPEGPSGRVLRALRALRAGASGGSAAADPVERGALRELFGDRVESLHMARSEYVERVASPRDYVELFKQTFGPLVALHAFLTDQPERAAALDRDFLEFATGFDRGPRGGPAEYHHEYLLVLARRRSA